MVLILIVGAIVVGIVAAYFFLRNNPNKKAKIDNVVNQVKEKL